MASDLCEFLGRIQMYLRSCSSESPQGEIPSALKGHPGAFERSVGMKARCTTAIAVDRTRTTLCSCCNSTASADNYRVSSTTGRKGTHESQHRSDQRHDTTTQACSDSRKLGVDITVGNWSCWPAETQHTVEKMPRLRKPNDLYDTRTESNDTR